ncbi:hypothetical protein [Haliea sp. E17]|uniref:hypothetical protein n=1 Tax=Haliea sp. E17 TaxID=3401576 RepID=UPI003AACC26D
MPKLVLSSDLQRFSDGDREIDVAAGSYPDLVRELLARYPALGEEIIRRQSLAIDGMIVHTPMLERFREDSQLVFVARIAGG